VCRDNNKAARLYEEALLRDPVQARRTALELHKNELGMQTEATSRIDRVLRFRAISGIRF